MDIIVFPYNIHSHWVTVKIDPKNTNIEVFDSKEVVSSENFQLLAHWLDYRYFIDFKIDIIQTKAQSNNSDCGPFGKSHINNYYYINIIISLCICPSYCFWKISLFDRERINAKISKTNQT